MKTANSQYQAVSKKKNAMESTDEVLYDNI